MFLIFCWKAILHEELFEFFYFHFPLLLSVLFRYSYNLWYCREAKEALLALFFQFQGQFRNYVITLSTFLTYQNISLPKRLFCLKEVLTHCSCSDSTNVSCLFSLTLWRSTLQQSLADNSIRLSALPVSKGCFNFIEYSKTNKPFAFCFADLRNNMSNGWTRCSKFTFFLGTFAFLRHWNSAHRRVSLH